MTLRFVVGLFVVASAASVRAGDWSVYGGPALGQAWGTIKPYRGTHRAAESYVVGKTPPAGSTCPRPSPRASYHGDSAGVSGGLVLGARRRAGPIFELALGGEAAVAGPPSRLTRRLDLLAGMQAPDRWVADLDGWRAIPAVVVGAGWGTVFNTAGSQSFYRDGYALLAALRYDFRRDSKLARVQLTYRALLARHQRWELQGDPDGGGSASLDFHLDGVAMSHEVGFGVVIGFEVGG